MSLLVLDNSGYHGFHGSTGSSGHHGIGSGGHGGQGGRGQTGGDAGHGGSIDIKLDVSGDQSSISTFATLEPKSGVSQTAKHSHNFVLGDPQAEIQMYAYGGTGGNGGRGGRGGDGAMGYHGTNATRYSSGGNGGPGGDGGRGGDGGGGGRGGNGAQIIVRVDQVNMDTIMLLRQRVSPTYGGRGGLGGSGGSGGNGGPGGPGGASYSWQESSTYTDANGNQQTTYTTHTNPGGHSGPSGRSGSSGSRGSDGRDGSSSYYSIALTRDTLQVENFSSPYDLQLKVVKYIDTIGYHVIEPASHVYLWVTHQNVGGMPTPSHQLIRTYVADNQWVLCPVQHRVPTATWIQSGNSVEINRPILFEISDVFQPARGDPFKVTAYMQHRALVDRVNQDFERVRKEQTPFTVQYPVSASLIRGATAITFQEEAPIVFSMLNIARLPIGIQAPLSRVLFVKLKINLNTTGGSLQLEKTDVVLKNAYGAVYEDSALGLHADLVFLGGGDLQHFASTLKFVNPDVKPYTRMQVEGSLYLGHVKDMLNPINIQIRPFEIQLADAYMFNPEASQFLIVANNRTVYDEVEKWKNILRPLGAVSVWNVSLYGDLGLNHRKKDGRTLLEDFRGKNIIFLNNFFLQDEKLDKSAIWFAQAREIYLAARDFGINTYIVGKHYFDLSLELVPALPKAPKPVFFKSKKALLKNMERRIATGAGFEVGTPAAAESDMCGCLMLKDKLKWVNLNLENKTLCYYDSARQKFPDGMIYLETAVIQVEEPSDSQLEFKLIDAGGKIHEFKFAPENKSRSKEKKYGTRKNFVSGCGPWIDILKRVVQVEKVESDIKVEGFLKKRGGESKSFVKRWFRFDATRKILTYSASQNSQKFKSIPMGRYSITQGNFLGRDSGNEELKFQIQTPSRCLSLMAATEAEKSKWIETILNTIAPIEASPIFQEPSVKAKRMDITKRLSVSSLYDGFSKTPTMLRRRELTINESMPNMLPNFLSTSTSTSEVENSNSNPTSPVSGPLSPTTAIRADHISKIQVESRYIISKPSEGDLKKKAKQLQEKLAARFPNQRNVVVYDFNLNSKKSTFLHHIGDLEVYRSLDSTTSNIVVSEVSDDMHMPSVIESRTVLFGYVKSLDFMLKLHLLNSEVVANPKIVPCFLAGILEDSPPMLSVVVMAIISDLFDEQFYFRNSSWRAGLETEVIRSRLEKMDILSNYQFFKRKLEEISEENPDPIREVILEIGVHLQIIMNNFTSIWDKMLLRRRGTDVTKATLQLWDETLNLNFGEPDKKGIFKLNPKLKDNLKERMLSKKLIWREIITKNSRQDFGYKFVEKSKKIQKLGKKEALRGYSHVPGISIESSSNPLKVPHVLSKAQFEAMKIANRPSNVIEDRHFFPDDASRLNVVNGYASRDLPDPSQVENKRLKIVQDGNWREGQFINSMSQVSILDMSNEDIIKRYHQDQVESKWHMFREQVDEVAMEAPMATMVIPSAPMPDENAEPNAPENSEIDSANQNSNSPIRPEMSDSPIPPQMSDAASPPPENSTENHTENHDANHTENPTENHTENHTGND
eukprot:TRINITY_DN2425_c0_g1_i1.p1 TRINITY_DN2425_c0_g1~~TRINITY_DN2425_c0_g1_i1.p1  ORF type:complete len:1559 (-),score=662.55 TRINITY_DN2425_c0_g1_i1:96-4772(-)